MLSLPPVGRVGAQRRGGGSQLTNNRVHYAVEVLINFRVPEAEHFETLRFEKVVARSIRCLVCLQRELTSIGFDDNPLPERNKIYDVAINGRLFSKVKSGWL